MRTKKHKLTEEDKKLRKILRKWYNLAGKGRLIVEEFSMHNDVTSISTSHDNKQQYVYHGTQMKITLYQR